MINYISTIMQELGYDSDTLALKLGSVDHQFKVFIKDKSAFIISSIDTSLKHVLNEFISSYQPSIFETVMTSKKFKAELKKNSYLLVLIEDSISSQYPRKLFINIEEDPFFFKKYILRYKESDLRSLLEKTTNSNIVTSLGQLAIDHNVFSKFSEESQNRTGYESLLYQIYVKIPALNLPTTSKDIGDLSKEINSKLIEENLKPESDSMHRFLDEADEKNIDLNLFKKIVSQL